MRKLPKYVQAWVNKDGRTYHYSRRPGFARVPLPGLPWSPEFMAAYERAMHVDKLPIGADRSKPGSVAAAVANYLNNSADFIQEGKLAKGTKAARRAILNRFRDRYGELPIKLMHRKFISAMLAKLSAHAARNWFKAIRVLCAFCVEQEIISVDPTIGMKAPKVPKSNGFHTWIEDEVDAYRQHYPIGTKARVALELGIMTLQRRGDVVEMGRQHIARGEVIKVGPLVISKWLRAMDQQKTGTKYDIPIFPDLQHVLDATPSAHLTFLVTKTGKPYAPNDFSEQFRAWCDEAGLPQRCSFHGLRKAGCVYFAERGCSASEIASWSGHLSLREVERYVREANRKKMAANALRRVLEAEAAEAEAENETGQKVSNPSAV